MYSVDVDTVAQVMVGNQILQVSPPDSFEIESVGFSHVWTNWKTLKSITVGGERPNVMFGVVMYGEHYTVTVPVDKIQAIFQSQAQILAKEAKLDAEIDKVYAQEEKNV